MSESAVTYEIQLPIRLRIIDTARSYIGRIPYLHKKGGPLAQARTLDGMNCYAFAAFVLSENGLYVPEEWGCFEMLERLPHTCDPFPGDLGFSNGRRDGKPGHMWLKTEKDSAVHLSKNKGTVIEMPMAEMHRSYRIIGYRSIEPFIREICRNNYERPRLSGDAGLALQP